MLSVRSVARSREKAEDDTGQGPRPSGYVMCPNGNPRKLKLTSRQVMSCYCAPRPLRS